MGKIKQDPRIEAYIEHHVLDRYQEFYPDATFEDVYDALLEATPVERNTIHPLIGRRGHRDGDTGSFYVHKSRTGAFVLDDGAVRTFFRFYSESQRAMARKLWGSELVDDSPESGQRSLEKLSIVVSRGAGRLFGGKDLAKDWIRAHESSSVDGWEVILGDPNNPEVLEPERLWHYEGRAVGLIGQGLWMARRRDLSQDLGSKDCAVGPVTSLLITDRVMAMYGRDIETRPSKNTLQQLARGAIADGEWVQDGAGWTVATQCGSEAVSLVVWSHGGEWWVATTRPPALSPDVVVAIDLLLATGWSVCPASWDD